MLITTRVTKKWQIVLPAEIANRMALNRVSGQISSGFNAVSIDHDPRNR
jgi:hypothetical protein